MPLLAPVIRTTLVDALLIALFIFCSLWLKCDGASMGK
jgi:hypothetical protein